MVLMVVEEMHRDYYFYLVLFLWFWEGKKQNYALSLDFTHLYKKEKLKINKMLKKFSLKKEITTTIKVYTQQNKIKKFKIDVYNLLVLEV